MKNRSVFSLPALAILLTAPWFALSPAAAQNRDGTKMARCEVYQDQFDKMRFSGKFDQHPNLKEAIRYRRLGERFCNQAHKAEGQKVLKHAIGLLDAKPEKPGREQDFYWSRD